MTLRAPSGMIRAHRFGWKRRLLYSNLLLPGKIIEKLVDRDLTPGKSDDRARLDTAVEDKVPNSVRSDFLLHGERLYCVATIEVGSSVPS